MMLSTEDTWDRAPTLSDLERAPRGPRRSGGRPTLGASPTVAIASVSLIGTLLAMGAAAASAPSQELSSTSHGPCLGTIVVKSPSVAHLGRVATVVTQFHPAHGLKASCAGSLSFVYSGLPAGMTGPAGPVVVGTPGAPGVYHASVTVTGTAVPLTSFFTMTVV
jgi:hypothetical protein